MLLEFKLKGIKNGMLVVIYNANRLKLLIP